ncbi:hypothetical protein ABBQ38_009111 [Trebouxia sp. C0009 RCD-2024]
MHAYNLRCTHHPWSPCMHAHERAHRARPETLPVVLSAVVAAGLVGYIGYTVYTGKGKNSPMSTIDQEKETTTNNKDQQPYSGGKKEGNSVNARSERSSIA